MTVDRAVMSRFRLIAGTSALLAISICVPRDGYSQSSTPVDRPWVGSARCQLDIQGAGYADQQIHTWTITATSPTIQGAFRVYAATWSVTGGGSSQRVNGTQTSSSRWTTNGQSLTAPIAVFARATDGAVVIQPYHAQQVARGAITGALQVTSDGRALPAAPIAADAFEWAFPVATGTATSTTLTGSSNPPVNGSIGYLQPAGTVGRAACSWQFGVAGTTPATATATIAPAPLPAIIGIDAGAGSIATTSPTTATIAPAPVAGATVTPTNSTLLNGGLATLTTTPMPRTVTLSGFTATGSFAAASPRTITLAGFTAAGVAAAIAPRTINVGGFTASGIAGLAPRTIVLTGFSAAGTAVAVAPRTIPLGGWTSAGP